MRELLGEHIEDKNADVTRELTVEEAVAIAISLHQADRVGEADAVYRQILAVAPDHPRALHFGGVLAHQLGRGDEAIALIRRSLELAPDDADWHSNFGIVLQERGSLDEAIAAYRQAIAINPEHANAYSNLGVLLRATGKLAEAEDAYRTAIRLNPEHIDAYTNLGVLLNAQKRSEEAVDCYCRAITLRPRHPEARRLLALAHCKLGDVEKAIQIFEEWLAEEPDDAIARHMLAACTGRAVPQRASDDFVSRTFDGFAASFESKLARLSYRAPALVSAMLQDAGVDAAKRLDVLDAGCGTGLCGPLVAPYARRLIGVDLSAGMLIQAKEKQVYDDLYQFELTAFLRDNPAAYDLIVSADTLCYFGSLDEVVSAAAAALRPGGLIVFTVERGPAEGPDFMLEQHGRYTHAQTYVEGVLRREGLVPEIAEGELRLESGTPVAGLVVRARKLGVAP